MTPLVAQVGNARETRSKNRFESLAIFIGEGKIVVEVVFDLLVPDSESFFKGGDWEERTNSVIDFSVFVCVWTLMPNVERCHANSGSIFESLQI